MPRYTTPELLARLDQLVLDARASGDQGLAARLDAIVPKDGIAYTKPELLHRLGQIATDANACGETGIGSGLALLLRACEVRSDAARAFLITAGRSLIDGCLTLQRKG